jgi:DNA-binding response OmpR family regulator
MSDKKFVLVIDDDPDIVTFLTALLQDNGYETDSAPDGMEGLKKTRERKPDLILLDITMPEKSGVRYYRDVREDEELKSIPVIMVTGVMKEFEGFIHKRRQVPPPDGYIHKPVDKQLLLDTMEEVLSKK